MFSADCCPATGKILFSGILGKTLNLVTHTMILNPGSLPKTCTVSTKIDYFEQKKEVFFAKKGCGTDKLKIKYVPSKIESFCVTYFFKLSRQA